MRIPIRYQFMLPLFVVAAASLLAVGLIYSRLATSQTKDRIERQLRSVVAALEQSTYPLTDAVLRQMGGLANAEFVLTDDKGRQLASGSSVRLKGFVVDELTASKASEVALGAVLVLDAKTYLHSSVWVRRRPLVAQRNVLHILFAQDEFDAAWRAAFLPPVLVGLVTISAVALVTHWVAGRVSRILARLGKEVERLAEGDFSEVRQPEWDDETRDLALAVNQTAARLVDYESELRQTERLRTVAMLGAGLAHEMRNAATGCRLAVDLHAEGCQGGASDESLDVARRQLALMESRLQQLLHLGNPREASQDQRLNLSELIAESVALIQPAARHAGVELVWNQPAEEMVVQADAEILGQAVMNVLLNALDAAAKSQAADGRAGRVSIEMHRRDDESELIVTDSGDGPSEQIAGKVAGNVFEPFVTSKPEGVGLGLAVAKRIVESYNGSIVWDRVADATQFSIRLPLAAAGVGHV